jgi:hypothetical protein
MTVGNFKDLRQHIGHKIVCVCYSDGEFIYNVSLECETCSEVLISYDNPKLDNEGW